MIMHILAGDSLAESFHQTDIEGEIVVCRECLIEGETDAQSLEEFWQLRAKFFEKTYAENNYHGKTVREFEKINHITANDEVNLWFGNELFCQTNMWFCLSLLENSNAKIYRIFPESKGWNCKFEDLKSCFEGRIKLLNQDLRLGEKLWKAYQMNDYIELTRLGETKSPIFLRLSEVCQAEIEKSFRPKEILLKIHETEFSKIFQQFSTQSGIYGFGDLQVKRILEQIKIS